MGDDGYGEILAGATDNVVRASNLDVGDPDSFHVGLIRELARVVLDLKARVEELEADLRGRREQDAESVRIMEAFAKAGDGGPAKGG